MPFGLYNAPATFERLMETVLKGLTFEACLIYLDDVIIGGRTFEEHLQNIRKVLSKLSDANLKLNPSKCKFFQKEVNYLGHIISAEGVLDKECEDSFLQLKEALTSSPILIYPQPDKPFILDTDASNESVGAVLSQEIDGQERVVAYWSKCLSKPEKKLLCHSKRATGYCESHRAFPSLSLWPKISSTYRSCLFNLANEF
ncbi:retrovirus-related Pol polyprotein from transposon 297 [Trichonephila clavipes]|nr:retrovirus-related Pol polyprotein from transposon 297 [Trichonephila clavipes]